MAVALAGIVGRAEHGEVREVEGKVRPGLAALDVIDVEVFPGRKLMLVAAAELAAPVVGSQDVVADAPPFRRLQEGGRRDEARRPPMSIAPAAQEADDRQARDRENDEE